MRWYPIHDDNPSVSGNWRLSSRTGLPVLLYNGGIYRNWSKDYAWDGTYGGHQAGLGVYAYRITFKDLQEEVRDYMRHVTLIR
jgi:hypothetical protein